MNDTTKGDVPATRAHVLETDPSERGQAPRRWNKDRKVWMRKSVSQTFDYIMFVDGWEYNEDRGGWDYWLKDENGIKYGNLVKETDTTRA